jgi:hypothetical protein
MYKSIKPFTRVLVFSLLLLSACSYMNSVAPTQISPNLIYTAAAQTIMAQLTQAASSTILPSQTPQTPVDTPTQTQTPQPPVDTPTQTQTEPLPTDTNIPTTAVPPTNTPLPPTATPEPATPTPVPCNRMDFVKDINYPDNTLVNPGVSFDKTWRFRNTGSCTWNSNYVLIFDHGDALDAPASVLLTNRKVHPGETVDVTVPDLVAPDEPGSYQGFWKVRDGEGHVFGYGSANKAFWVKITVTNPINYDFLAKAKKAEWKNATTTVTFGAAFSDKGLVDIYENVRMENGTTYDKGLATYPERIDDGIIMGLFSSYTIANGDHFRSKVGFRYDCSDGQVKFHLGYKEGDTVKQLKEWSKKCDGNLLSLDYDLSSLKKHDVQLILGVSADGASSHDNVLWISPRIQK